jgi:hypothetical protein
LAPLEKRKQSRVATRLLALSQTYELASREMSLVAVVKRAGDRPAELPDTRVVPVGMPQDTAFAAYFAAGPIPQMAFSPLMPDMAAAPLAPLLSNFNSAAASSETTGSLKRSQIRFSGLRKSANASNEEARAVETAGERLLDLAARMDSDGGMPGKNPESRAIATVVALLAFLSQGHTPSSGAFRSHVARLVSFLKSTNGLLAPHQQQVVTAVIELARKGSGPTGEWIALAHTSGDHWKEVERLVLN